MVPDGQAVVCLLGTRVVGGVVVGGVVVGGVVVGGVVVGGVVVGVTGAVVVVVGVMLCFTVTVVVPLDGWSVLLPW